MIGKYFISNRLKEIAKISVQMAKSPLNRSLKSEEVIFLAFQSKFLFKIYTLNASQPIPPGIKKL